MAGKKAVASRPDAEESAPGTAAVALPKSDYVVFARRFRPQSFSEVAGQTAVTSALRQALVSGRIAQAYLLCGPRGVGKTSLARIFAKSVNCLKGTGPGGVAEEPCNACDACEAIQQGRSLDVIEMDAATNRGIEEIRSLRDNVGISPSELRYKVYIIDEVHMLTREAWNAFLKTLEEPPAHVKFIFATTDPNDVPETILSRCQRYDLRRIGPADIVKRLKQICELDSLQYEEMALSRIASLAKGGLRDAEGLLDQAVNLGGGKVTDAVVRDLSGAAPDELIFEILKACAAGKVADVLMKTHVALESGADPEDMLVVLIERLRGTLLSRVCGADSPLLEGQTHLKTAFAELAAALSDEQCLMLIQLFTAARRQMRDATQTRLPLEMALVRAARASELVDLGKLMGAVEASLSRPNAPSAAPPNREGPRPNLSGRPADIVPDRPTANPTATPAVSTASTGGTNFWPRVIATLQAKRARELAQALSQATVNIDAATSILVINLAPQADRNTVDAPANQALLNTAVLQICGRPFEIRIGGATAAKPAARAPSTSPPRPQPQVSAPQQEDEYHEADALPLASRPNSGEAEAAPVTESEESFESAAPAAAFVAAPVVKRAVEARVAVDAQSAEKHPVVQALLKSTGGMLIEVSRSRKADKKAEPAKSGRA